jgi:diaminohydroxyphosphoribosylaminopyrimidine deaminase/5-amino-6-(5-phosphoribosylamino)uracil reductase
MTATPEDLRYLRAALALGARELGATAENPAVGALVVKDGVVLGRGWTQAGGRPHAEPMALAQAGEAARGATLYVTLEPCAHYGKTPPCAEAVVASGVTRVVGGLADPDPRTAGKGFAFLRANGIDVVTDALPRECRRAHRGHILRVTENRPMVTLKISRTPDGFAAGAEHDRRLAITGLAANLRTHVLRSLHDAIMVGIGTALGDDPLLTVRLPGVTRQPLRVVLDARCDLPPRSRLAVGARDVATLVICGAEADRARRAALEELGIETADCALAEGRIDLRAALSLLARRGLARVFSEGGPSIAAQLIAQGLADEALLFTGPRPLGRSGVEALSAPAREKLDDPACYRLMAQGLLGADAYSHYERL